MVTKKYLIKHWTLIQFQLCNMSGNLCIIYSGRNFISTCTSGYPVIVQGTLRNVQGTFCCCCFYCREDMSGNFVSWQNIGCPIHHPPEIFIQLGHQKSLQFQDTWGVPPNYQWKTPGKPQGKQNHQVNSNQLCYGSPYSSPFFFKIGTCSRFQLRHP